MLYHVCPPVRKIMHSLKLVDYLHVQADNPWYNYYVNSISTGSALIANTKAIYHEVSRPPDKSVYCKTIFFISHPKHICCGYSIEPSPRVL